MSLSRVQLKDLYEKLIVDVKLVADPSDNLPITERADYRQLVERRRAESSRTLAKLVEKYHQNSETGFSGQSRFGSKLGRIIADCVTQGGYTGDSGNSEVCTAEGLSMVMSQLELYCLNLLDFPWKIEIHVIWTYCGNYYRKVKMNCPNLDLLLISLIGYHPDPDNADRLCLTSIPPRHVLISWAFRFFCASVEFNVQSRLYTPLESLGIPYERFYHERLSYSGPDAEFRDYVLERCTDLVNRVKEGDARGPGEHGGAKWVPREHGGVKSISRDHGVVIGGSGKNAGVKRVPRDHGGIKSLSRNNGGSCYVIKTPIDRSSIIESRTQFGRPPELAEPRDSGMATDWSQSSSLNKGISAESYIEGSSLNKGISAESSYKSSPLNKGISADSSDESSLISTSIDSTDVRGERQNILSNKLGLIDLKNDEMCGPNVPHCPRGNVDLNEDGSSSPDEHGDSQLEILEVGGSMGKLPGKGEVLGAQPPIYSKVHRTPASDFDKLQRILKGNPLQQSNVRTTSRVLNDDDDDFVVLKPKTRNILDYSSFRKSEPFSTVPRARGIPDKTGIYLRDNRGSIGAASQLVDVDSTEAQTLATPLGLQRSKDKDRPVLPPSRNTGPESTFCPTLLRTRESIDREPVSFLSSYSTALTDSQKAVQPTDRNVSRTRQQAPGDSASDRLVNKSGGDSWTIIGGYKTDGQPRISSPLVGYISPAGPKLAPPRARGPPPTRKGVYTDDGGGGGEVLGGVRKQDKGAESPNSIWQCKSCTFANLSTDNTCVMCENRRKI